MGTPDKGLLDSLGTSPEDALGYIYAGVVPALLAAIVDPDGVRSVTATVGPIATAAIALGAGSGIYVLYRRVLGDLMLYPLQHALHRWFDKLCRRSGVEQTSCTGFLSSLGVPWGQRQLAYDSIKHLLLPPQRHRELSHAHGELHFPYLTSALLASTATYAAVTGQPGGTSWLAASAVMLLVALIADTRQHSYEAGLLKSLNRQELLRFLSDHGFLRAFPELVIDREVADEDGHGLPPDDTSGVTALRP